MNTLPPFYVGQRVVAVRSHSDKAFVKDQKFTITSVVKGCCGWLVTIGIVAPYSYIEGLTRCKDCGTILIDTSTEWTFSSNSFAPIQTDFQGITYQQVMENESSLINCN